MSLDERVAALEARVTKVNQRVDQVQRELHQEVKAREDALSSERSTRDREVAEINKRLKSVGTGGVGVLLMGLVWLATGLTLSTIPGEILCVLK